MIRSSLPLLFCLSSIAFSRGAEVDDSASKELAKTWLVSGVVKKQATEPLALSGKLKIRSVAETKFGKLIEAECERLVFSPESKAVEFHLCASVIHAGNRYEPIDKESSVAIAPDGKAKFQGRWKTTIPDEK